MPLVCHLVETDTPEDGDEWKGEVVSCITEVYLNYDASPPGKVPAFSITLRQQYTGEKPQEVWLSATELQQILRHINADLHQKTIGPSEDCEVTPLEDWDTGLEEW